MPTARPARPSSNVTFSGISGTLVDAPMVITNAVNVYGNPLGTNIIGSEGVATGSTGGAAVTVLKETGNEFEVNPPASVNIYNSGTALNSDEPAVAMEGSGDFVITWRQEVPQQLAPKDITDIYFRRYAPMGITTASVPGEQYSDVVGNLPNNPYFTGVRALAAPTQQLTLHFNPVTVGPYTGTFELLVGTGATAPISFSSADLPTSAANIQAALVSLGYTGTLVTVVGETSAATYGFNITLNGAAGNTGIPPIQYVGGMPSTVAFSNSATAASTSQQLTFNAALVPVQQFTELTVGTVTTAPIYFDSTNPANTAAAIKTALVNAGFAGANVLVDAATTATDFIFDVSFFNPHAPIGIALNMAVTSSPTVVAVPTSTATTALRVRDHRPLHPASGPRLQQPAVRSGCGDGPRGAVRHHLGQLGPGPELVQQHLHGGYDENGNEVAFVGTVGNSTLTNYDYAPDVAMGDDGMVVVTYSGNRGLECRQRDYGRHVGLRPRVQRPVGAALELGERGPRRRQHHFHGRARQLRRRLGRLSGTDPNGYNPTSQILGAEYQLENYTRRAAHRRPPPACRWRNPCSCGPFSASTAKHEYRLDAHLAAGPKRQY